MVVELMSRRPGLPRRLRYHRTETEPGLLRTLSDLMPRKEERYWRMRRTGKKSPYPRRRPARKSKSVASVHWTCIPRR